MFKFFPSILFTRRLSWLRPVPVGLALALGACSLWEPPAPRTSEGATSSETPPSSAEADAPVTTPVPAAPQAAPQTTAIAPSAPSLPTTETAAPSSPAPGAELPTGVVPSSPSPEDQVVAIDDEEILKLVKKTEDAEAIVRQNSGQTTLYLVLTNLQTERLFQPQFPTSIAALPARLPGETDSYRLAISSANADAAYATALPKIKGLPSYIGAAYAGEAGTPPIIGICKSNAPTLEPPGEPQLVKGQVICAQGSTVVALK